MNGTNVKHPSQHRFQYPPQQPVQYHFPQPQYQQPLQIHYQQPMYQQQPQFHYQQPLYQPQVQFHFQQQLQFHYQQPMFQPQVQFHYQQPMYQYAPCQYNQNNQLAEEFQYQHQEEPYPDYPEQVLELESKSEPEPAVESEEPQPESEEEVPTFTDEDFPPLPELSPSPQPSPTLPSAVSADNKSQKFNFNPAAKEFVKAEDKTRMKIMDGGGEHLNGHYHMPYPGGNVQVQQSEEVTGIRDVWAHNLREEFRLIRGLIRNKYTYIAMDTEFPGVVARPLGLFRSTQDYHYQVLRCNCDVLRLIQAGITLLNEEGQLPPGITTWQFNFKFNLGEDMYAQESIDMLTNCGIQFKRHETDGIDPLAFSEELITSGLVLNDNIRWISFHSGYDFGYMYRLLMDRHLPDNENDFFDLLRLHFPYVYDIKYLMKSCRNLKGGLQDVADELQVERIGVQHQAGSDSLVTGLTFFRMKEMFFEDNIDDTKYNGHLYGLSATYAQYNEPMFALPQQAPPQSEHSATNF